MGQYSKLLISAYEICRTLDEIDPFILILFQAEDLKCFSRQIVTKHYDYEENAAIFRNKAFVIRERLNLMGISLRMAKESFDKGKMYEIEKITKFLKSSDFGSNHDFKIRLEAELGILSSASFEDFLEACKQILNKNNRNTDSNPRSQSDKNAILDYLFEEGLNFKRFPYFFDERTLLRAILEIAPDETFVEYDVSDLYDDDYIEEYSEEIYANNIYPNFPVYKYFEKIIILAEGSTDIQFIKDSLNILYPHLSDYFSFMDFRIVNSSGSAGSLISIVKSFIGANIKNRIIVLFDNDKVGNDCVASLLKHSIPENIKIITYPDIELAENYPVKEGDNVSLQNINRKAGSIELYLGRDVLLKNNEFIPVEITKRSGDNQIITYCITNKKEIKKKFKKKVKNGTKNMKVENWKEMDLLLKAILTAFID